MMEWFHRHRWEVVNCAHMNQKTMQQKILEMHGRDITEVLLKCRCGDFKTRTIDGLWDVEDLKKQTTDEDFLKKLKVKL